MALLLNGNSNQVQTKATAGEFHEAKPWTVKFVTFAVSYMAAKAYEVAVANKRRLPFQEIAKEVLALISGVFVDLEAVTHDVVFIEEKKAGRRANKKVQDVLESYQGVDPEKTVSGAEYENRMASVFKEEDGYVTVETPKQETEIMEGLLGMLPGKLSDSRVKYKKGFESCRDCGRHYSFLDVVHTGFGIHNKQFMKDVLMGKYGYIVNHPPPQVHRCYQCNTPAPAKSVGYGSIVYGCG
jgi:hypothetical protein